MMAALASLPLTGMAANGDAGPAGNPRGSGLLVAYFSRTGNTRVIAGLIHRQLGTGLFEIQPAAPYPDDYLQTVEQARQERDAGYEPALRSHVADIRGYDTVFLGFPIWGTTTPPVIRSFLSTHDLSGKTLVPFVTHGGYGLGDSRSVIARLAPGARLLDGFVMEADQERRTMENVTDWLRRSPLGNPRSPNPQSGE
ncbi:flavodoxin protein [Achromobacter arsenitoxydans SY8]|uniref:Flavodoxin protein n=2 Tax=Achromobacter TaxID=222 RepID=H0FDT1_9BURK|nr:flavodoxin protein [Achromobacter arsenitoxydans SY8]